VNVIIKTDVAILLMLAVLNKNIARTHMSYCNAHKW